MKAAEADCIPGVSQALGRKPPKQAPGSHREQVQSRRAAVIQEADRYAQNAVGRSQLPTTEQNGDLAFLHVRRPLG